MKKVFYLIVISLVAVACATNPLTGRKSFNFVSNDEIFASSFQQYNEVKSGSKIITGTADANRIKTVGERIKSAAEKYYASIGKSNVLSGYQWEFNLIQDDKTINAWCMPGGKVAFYTGIMPICKDDAGVAVVMGHEIAHALAGHGAEKISQTYASQMVGQVLSGAINNEALKSTVDKYYPVASNITLLKYGRNQESDADEMGLYIMAMAGYDPRQAPIFWQRMIAATGSNNTPEFLSTHPNPENRIADLNAKMAKALEYYNAAVKAPVSSATNNTKLKSTKK